MRRTFSPRTLLLGLALGLVLVFLSSPGRADAPKYTPEARRLIDEVAKTYKGLAGYADEGSFAAKMTIDGKSRDQVTPVKIAFERPNKIAVDAGSIRFLGDGKTLTTVLAATRKYFDLPAPENLTPRVVNDGPLGAALQGGPVGEPAFLVLGLLLGQDIDKALPSRVKQVRVEDVTRDGKTYQALVLDRDELPGLRFLVDPTSRLFRHAEFIVDAGSLASLAPPGSKLTALSLSWDSGAIKTEVPAAETFAFKVPDGFSRLAAAEAPAVADEAEATFKVHSLLGKPAPEFSFVAFDGPGKTRRVTKEDFAGKVVLIDFWATWCGPCLEELPDVQKVAEAFGKDKKDVLFVTLSVDEEPEGDVPGIRKLIEKTLAEEKISFTTAANARSGIDVGHGVTDLFQIEGFPTIVILDRDGVIQGAHVGAGYPVVETLTKELDTLLKGKPLVSKPEKAASR